MPKPLIPYGRKSSREDPAASRARQDRSVSGWHERHPDEELAPMVWEPGVKGSRNWRERGLGEAIAACERGEASGIIVEEQNRLSRENGLATAEMWEALQRAGARLVCVTEGMDTADGDHELNFSIRAALAREQWKQYQRRADAAKRRAVLELGIHIGPAPSGYKREQGSGQPLELGDDWQAIREAFELRATGASYGAVGRFLDERLPGGPSGRGSWTRQFVQRMLVNRVYLGEARGGNYSKPNAHPAIVDGETFHAVQGLEQRCEREARPSARAMLAGIALCGSCGYSLMRSRVGKHWTVYKCRGRHAQARCEEPVSVMLDKLDALVLEQVLAELEREREEAVETPPDTSGIRARLAVAEAKRAPFEDPAYVKQLGLDAALRALRTVDEEVSVLQVELAEALSAGGDDAERRHDLAEGLRNGTDDERREILASMLEGVVVSRAPRGTAVADRVQVVSRGDVLPVARPSRGRVKVAAGPAAPQNGAERG